MEELTKKEEEVMHLVWELKQAFVKEIIAEMPNSKPPYNTVSSIVRILDQKGFVGHEAFGKTHRYFPVISKFEYRKNLFGDLVHNYFEDSIENVLSFMISEKKLSPKELKELKEIVEKTKRS